MAYQVERIIINAVGARSLKFFLSVPSGEETDSECSRSPSGQQVPYAVPHHDRSLNVHAEALSSREEKVGVRFGKMDLISRDNGNVRLDGKKIKCRPGRLHEAACGYRPGYAEIGESS